CLAVVSRAAKRQIPACVIQVWPSISLEEDKMAGVLSRAAALGAIMALGVATSALAADWPQFLGPQRDGVAHDARGLARAWPEGGPKVLWETPVGPGYGGAAIYGDGV